MPVIILDGLGSDRFPPFVDVDLTIRPRELPVVICPDDEERIGFINLLLGQTPESSGQILRDDQPLSPTERRAKVIVLSRAAALSPDSTAIENLELVAATGGVRLDAAQRKRILEFAKIANGKVMPERLSVESRLRLSLALNVLGDLALVIALDPQPDVARVLPDLLDDHRALLVVSASRAGMELRPSQVHLLRGGRLDPEAAPELGQMASRRYRLRVAKATGESTPTPKSLLQTYPGITVTQAPNGDFLLDLDAEVAGTRVVRLMVQAGIGVESIIEEPRRG